LISFDGAFPKLTDGRNMFNGCSQLNEASISHIINSLPTYKEGYSAMTEDEYYEMNNDRYPQIFADDYREIDENDEEYYEMFEEPEIDEDEDEDEDDKDWHKINKIKYHEIGFVNVPALTEIHIQNALAKGWTVIGG